METKPLTGNDLLTLGYPEGKIIGIALKTLQTHFTNSTLKEQTQILQAVLAAPAAYQDHPTLAPIATVLLEPKFEKYLPLPDSYLPFAVYDKAGIEEGALKQMRTAMRLPVAVAGALMPDAHQGYGLPIGGVLATQNAVIPYGVGVYIGCRMCLTIYPVPASFIEQQRQPLKKILLANTRFGRATFHKPLEHAVIDQPEFTEIPVLRTLKDRAFAQLGSSGGGNHFVEFGIAEIPAGPNEWNLAPGNYLAILSHSGSRGMGATIAGHYTKLAMAACPLPPEAKHLAWLDLNTEAGQEYWRAMNLAGDYASACHHQIHQRLAAALALEPLARIENHHNFAWKEKDASGNNLIVHRKGATPAGKGVLGIIPGSMATPGFIVRGKGVVTSINSASHGAGRTMSRTKAKSMLSVNQVQQYLQAAGVEVLGSGLDEAPMAYKDIHQVMAAQQDLVEVAGTFYPKIVRMCGDEQYKEVD
ncbi:RtcB family protein [Adhaeribacter pallidiroseus]|uniref:3'-phosphate/5'-hydroxy nucleic acid ligase n=1 Tax=Adhaeribacter pallidiroseus TaxID=2072847 RepID=A0A369QF61_9BACT|nr:RtcB family protein [Adhaeribacter pallidiroseus]RDC61897.1 RNA ligase (ATP) [Adhaeribacter pallidiroseus]